jgi:hypothetical protein
MLNADWQVAGTIGLLPQVVVGWQVAVAEVELNL